jgi:cyclic dehypoxanthinyl futalosine synthase
MNSQTLLDKIISNEHVGDTDAFILYSMPLPTLMVAADFIRRKKHPEGEVSYIIDRNINITNICFSFCEFCNFCTSADSIDAYITTPEQYRLKISELYKAGGNQLLLQGGMHPGLGIEFYEGLFISLKQMFPDLYLHALSPSEIQFLAQKENMPVKEVLERLVGAGLDSLPGGGAEILVDRVRKKLSPLKADSEQWLAVMRVAHSLGLSTTATMMFGHIETLDERIEHMLKIRALQSENTGGGPGFISFIPWTFQSGNTRLQKNYPGKYRVYAHEYLKTIAISRILLHNIPNIQASWLTAGTDTATLALHSGANDLGSIMLEENVVASTGIYGRLSEQEMKNMIIKSGFLPVLRNQKFETHDS